MNPAASVARIELILARAHFNLAFILVKLTALGTELGTERLLDTSDNECFKATNNRLLPRALL